MKKTEEAEKKTDLGSPVIVRYSFLRIRGLADRAMRVERERVFLSELAARIWLSDQKKYSLHFVEVISARKVSREEAEETEERLHPPLGKGK